MADDSGLPDAQVFSFGAFELLRDRHLPLRNGASVRIGSRAVDILKDLAATHGRVVSKAELMSKAWPDTFVEEDNPKVNVAALRRALGDTSVNARFVASVFGRGYRFVSPARPPIRKRRAAPKAGCRRG